ncbi:hypothetical protein AABB24_037077, partial [Solanum stoloniferum]
PLFLPLLSQLDATPPLSLMLRQKPPGRGNGSSCCPPTSNSTSDQRAAAKASRRDPRRPSVAGDESSSSRELDEASSNSESWRNPASPRLLSSGEARAGNPMEIGGRLSLFSPLLFSFSGKQPARTREPAAAAEISSDQQQRPTTATPANEQRNGA